MDSYAHTIIGNELHVTIPGPEPSPAEDRDMSYAYRWTAPSVPEFVNKHHEVGRAHWLEIHTKKNPTKEWLRDWFERIPNFDCGGTCKRNFVAILKRIRYLDWIDWIEPDVDAVVFNDFFAFGHACHNAVNAKLNKPILALEDALKLYEME